MTRFYGIDEANEALPDVERILLDLRDQRAELIRLRDAVLAASRGSGSNGSAEQDAPPGDPDAEAPTTGDPDARNPEAAAARRLMRLRMQGLIDFPALASGRQIWLCWRLGESDIEWWHELDEGFAGRRRLTDLT